MIVPTQPESEPTASPEHAEVAEQRVEIVDPLSATPEAAAADGEPAAAVPAAPAAAAAEGVSAGQSSLSSGSWRFDPRRHSTYCQGQPERLYDVGIITRIPGRPHALRMLATVMASAAVTNGLRDARRVFIIINNHYDANTTAHHSALLKNLNVGSTSVHFLPGDWQPQQVTGMLFAMHLHLRANEMLGSAAHGLLTLEDDIALAPGFADRMQEALRQADQHAQTKPPDSTRPFYLMLYKTSEKIVWEVPRRSNHTVIKDLIREAIKKKGLPTMDRLKWSTVEVRLRDSERWKRWMEVGVGWKK